MAIKKCPKKLLRTVEICGEICEAAKEPICTGCRYCKTGEKAIKDFIKALDKECKADTASLTRDEYYRNKINDEVIEDLLGVN